MKFGNISSFYEAVSFNNAKGISSAFFYYGCNFKCGFCHNYKMLSKPGPLFSEKNIYSALRKSKRDWVSTIVVSGGEPTLDKGLKPFLSLVKNSGFKVKLDTNGSNPEVLEDLIKNDLIDYIAMDIKGTKNKYKEICNYDNFEKIEKSINLIKTLNDYEFRTTILPLHHKKEDLEEIGIWLKDSKKYVMQQFQPDLKSGCLDETYKELDTYSESELLKFKEMLNPYFKEVIVKCK